MEEWCKGQVITTLACVFSAHKNGDRRASVFTPSSQHVLVCFAVLLTILTYKGGNTLFVDLSHALYNCLVIFNPQFFQVITFLSLPWKFHKSLVKRVPSFLNCKEHFIFTFYVLAWEISLYEVLVRNVFSRYVPLIPLKLPDKSIIRIIPLGGAAPIL